MKNRLAVFFALLMLISTFSLRAQVLKGPEAERKVPGAELVRLSATTGNPDYIQVRADARPSVEKAEVWVRKAFTMAAESSWTVLREERDAMGDVHYRCQQTWNGIPVDDGIFLIHTRNGQIYSLNGKVYRGIEASNQLTISRERALDLAIQHVGATKYSWQNPAEEAVLKRLTQDPTATYFPNAQAVLVRDKKEGNFYYAWMFDIYAAEPLSRQELYIDANTGIVRRSLNRIHTTDKTGTVVTKYSGTKTMTTDSTGPGAFRLRETGRGNGIETYDMNNGTNYGSAVDFTDSDNYWNNVNASQDEVAGDAHWGTEMTYDYYHLNHGRNSIDNNGFALLSYVHYDNDYSNAFWNGSYMTYGDGDGSSTSPLTALDITAHEITHGLTTFTANLVYEEESGALSEGFSDIFGTAVEFFAKPTQANWTCGEDIGYVIRNLANPSAGGDPDTYQGNNWDPNQEVHTNSTVCSHWFYLLSQGGSGTNDNGDVYSVNAQGMTKAAAIAFRTLTVYLISSSDYHDAYFYSLIAATDLYGACTPAVESTADAWYAVGVGTAYENKVMPEFTANYTSMCSAPLTVQFSNQTINANTYLWRFGDGTTSTLQHPAHTYASTGDYSVKLIAYGGACGNDSLTKTSFISIQSGNTATISMPLNETAMAQTCCSGILTDNGGSEEYSNSTNSTLTIAPAGATNLVLTFSEFDFEAGYDYLYIYDGPSTASPLIGQYDGSSLPNGGIITSSGPSLTLRQSTDAGLTMGGFSATWLCNLPNAAPVATFQASTQESCIGIIQFTDHSSNAPVSWLWDFGDGSSSTQQNPVHAYQANGVYNVSLTAGNSFGSDSEIRTDYITVNMPAAPTVTDALVCDSAMATLTASGSGQLDWYDAPIGGNLLHSGSTFTTPMLVASTTYYVEDKLVHTSQYGGKTDNSGSGGYFSSSSSIHYQIFDVLSPLTLVSVKVYADGDGQRNIQLRDSAMTVLATASVFIPDGESRVTLNFELPVQNKLQLVGNGAMALYRNNNNSASYPYTLPGILTVTESSASLPPYNSTGNYYYFYDWEVRQPTCISARVPVNANVYECNGLAEAGGLSSLQISPNPTDGVLLISYPATEAGSLEVQICETSGRLLNAQHRTLQQGLTSFTIDLSAYASGVYFLKFTSGDESRMVRAIRK